MNGRVTNQGSVGKYDRAYRLRRQVRLDLHWTGIASPLKDGGSNLPLLRLLSRGTRDFTPRNDMFGVGNDSRHLTCYENSSELV